MHFRFQMHGKMKFVAPLARIAGVQVSPDWLCRVYLDRVPGGFVCAEEFEDILDRFNRAVVVRNVVTKNVVPTDIKHRRGLAGIV